MRYVRILIMTVLLCHSLALHVYAATATTGVTMDEAEQFKTSSYASSYSNTGVATSDGGFVTLKVVVVNTDNQTVVVKYDSNNNQEWSYTFNGNGTDSLYEIMQTSDGGYLAIGKSNSTDSITSKGGYDAVALKLTSSGTLSWIKSYGGTGDEYFLNLFADSDGGYTFTGVLGSQNGDFPLGKGSNDYLIVKTTSAGVLSWYKNYGGTSSDTAYSSERLSDGGLVLTGYSYSQDGDLVGLTKGGTTSTYDAFVIRTTSTGTLAYKKVFGGTLNDYFSGLIATSDGGFIMWGTTNSSNGDLTGLSYSSTDALVVKFTSALAVSWKTVIGGSASDFPNSVKQLSDGSYVVSGRTSSTNYDFFGLSKGGIDVFLIKLTSAGSKSYIRTFGGSVSDHSIGLEVASDNSIYLYGYTESNDGDVGSTLFKGVRDTFVLKYDAAGALVTKKIYGTAYTDNVYGMIYNSTGYVLLGSFNDVDTLVLNKTVKTSYTLDTLDTLSLAASIAPTNATNTGVTWSSSDASVATVSSTGIVTPVSSGLAVVTVTTADGGYKASVTVKVKGLKLDKSSVTQSTNQKNTLVPSYTDISVSDQSLITYSSSNTAIATVNSSGVITSVAEGTATVTATLALKSGTYTSTTVVNVQQGATSVALDQTAVSIKPNAVLGLIATVYPTNAVNKNVTWSSSNTSVVTVSSSGVLTGIADGTAVVTVSTADGAYTDTVNVTVYTPVTSITISPSSVDIVKGQTRQMTATIAPTDASNKNFTWSSDNTSIATVTSQGLLTAIEGGTTTIRATTEDGSYTDVSVVKVIVGVTGISFGQSSLTMLKGNSSNLVPSITPVNATNKNVTWSSSDSAVVSVTNGLLTAVDVGTATITATTEDGGYHSSVTITVTQSASDLHPVTGITLDKTELNLSVGDNSIVVPTIYPSNADNKSVTYTSSNTSVATVSDFGVVTGLAKGPAVITATTVDGGFVANAVVNVKKNVTAVTLNKNTLVLNPSATETLIATVHPTDANNTTLTWSSSNTNVVVVSSGGVVYAMGSGMSLVTVTSVDGSYTASCLVTVAPAVSGVSLNKYSVDLSVGEKEQLVGTIEPTNAINKNITWASSDSSIATVSSTGIVTAISGGSVYIHATSEDGGYVGTALVKVKVPVTAVVIDDEELTLNIGGNYSLVGTVLPVQASNKNVTWTSSNSTIVSVNSQGKVFAIGSGQSLVTVTTLDGRLEDSILITVVVPVTAITLDKSTVSLSVGKSEVIIPTVSPSGATNKTVFWTSADPTIATVSAGGLITGVALGTTTVTATTADGNFTETLDVAIKSAVTSVALNTNYIKLKPSENKALTATIEPENASNKNVVWTSSNSTVALISNEGVVYGVGTGIALITVTTVEGGYTASAIINVTEDVSGVYLSSDQVELYENELSPLVATVLPLAATNKNVTWESSNDAVVTVNSAGVLTAVSSGQSLITVTTSEGGYTDTAVVTVLPASNILTLDKNSVALKYGETSKITATWKSGKATLLTWSSSNESVAKVSSSGVVTAFGEGSAVIRVVAASGYSVSALVTVSTPLTNIGLSKEMLSIDIGTTHLLAVYCLPNGAKTTGVTWSSSDTGILTVDSNGLVTGVAKGIATVTATSAEGFSKVAYIEVGGSTDTIVLDKEEITATVGSTVTVTASEMPLTARVNGLVWSSNSNGGVILNNNVGFSVKVGLINTGTSTLTVIAGGGRYKTTITVKAIQKVSKITLNVTTFDLEPTKTVTLKPTIAPTNATNKKVFYSSTNEAIAKVSSTGVVTAIADGVASIVAVTEDGGFSALAKVTVATKATSIKLNSPNVSLNVGGTFTLVSTFAPTNTTNKSLTYTPSAKGVVNVSSTGVITAVKRGKVKVTVKTSNGKTAVCTVTVK